METISTASKAEDTDSLEIMIYIERQLKRLNKIY